MVTQLKCRSWDGLLKNPFQPALAYLSMLHDETFATSLPYLRPYHARRKGGVESS